MGRVVLHDGAPSVATFAFGLAGAPDGVVLVEVNALAIAASGPAIWWSLEVDLRAALEAEGGTPGTIGAYLADAWQAARRGLGRQPALLPLVAGGGAPALPPIEAWAQDPRSLFT